MEGVRFGERVAATAGEAVALAAVALGLTLAVPPAATAPWEAVPPPLSAAGDGEEEEVPFLPPPLPKGVREGAGEVEGGTEGEGAVEPLREMLGEGVGVVA